MKPLSPEAYSSHRDTTEAFLWETHRMAEYYAFNVLGVDSYDFIGVEHVDHEGPADVVIGTATALHKAQFTDYDYQRFYEDPEKWADYLRLWEGRAPVHEKAKDFLRRAGLRVDDMPLRLLRDITKYLPLEEE